MIFHNTTEGEKGETCKFTDLPSLTVNKQKLVVSNLLLAKVIDFQPMVICYQHQGEKSAVTGCTGKNIPVRKILNFKL